MNNTNKYFKLGIKSIFNTNLIKVPTPPTDDLESLVNDWNNIAEDIKKAAEKYAEAEKIKPQQRQIESKRNYCY